VSRLRAPSLAVWVAFVCAIGAPGPRPAIASTNLGGVPCAAIASAEPQLGHTKSPPAPVLFAADFPVLADCEWGYPLGGWGGSAARSLRAHLPVIFVHGNQADAENWFLVADQFRKAGYSDQELYAVSYNGLENASAGMPVAAVPSPESIAYWKANPQALDNGGHGTADDVNVPDVYAFVQAVMAYTGSKEVQIVAHSLGVTIVRKMLYDHPDLRRAVVAAVMIAGANHGTTVCRGLEGSYFGCDEIAPGTAWLGQLNSAGESPGPTCWMSVYNGAEGDPFFAGPDAGSPHLSGAVNLTFPGYYHNDLRVDPRPVAAYLSFLGKHQQPNRPCEVA
jgi:pimeloyl-ACP methyl ester carboxylesterase